MCVTPHNNSFISVCSENTLTRQLWTCNTGIRMADSINILNYSQFNSILSIHRCWTNFNDPFLCAEHNVLFVCKSFLYFIFFFFFGKFSPDRRYIYRILTTFINFIFYYYANESTIATVWSRSNVVADDFVYILENFILIFSFVRSFVSCFFFFFGSTT